ncbi:protein of unknown function [Alcaligenes faecalis subsp. faecalis]|nr:protein of unknown function [Alcaligenes faecalis subsp. faecalis]
MTDDGFVSGRLTTLKYDTLGMMPLY